LPRNYDSLREAHRRALDELDNHIKQSQTPAPEVGAAEVPRSRGPSEAAIEQAPTRPENHPSRSQSPDWPMAQNMDVQNAAANRMFKANTDRLNTPEAREHRAALAALNEHVDASRGGRGPDKETDIGRKPEDIDRKSDDIQR
jgi:hypothetical protein